MSDLPVLAIEPHRLESLRSRAAEVLTGSAAAQGATARAADALAVLHALASSPQTAADALKLLHELQVHQVELDLQAQELQESRAEMERALCRQTELLDHLPVGCCTVDSRRVLLELNQTGADLLGTAAGPACGQPLDAYFCTESAHRLAAAVAGLHAGQQHTVGLLTLCPPARPQRQVLVRIGWDPAAQPADPRYLVSLTPAGDEASAPRGSI